MKPLELSMRKDAPFKTTEIDVCIGDTYTVELTTSERVELGLHLLDVAKQLLESLK